MVIEDKLNDGLVDDLGHDDDGDKNDDSDVPPWQELILRGDGDGVLAVSGVPHDRRGGRRGPEGRVVLVVQVRQHHDHLVGRFSVSANTSFPNWNGCDPNYNGENFTWTSCSATSCQMAETVLSRGCCEMMKPFRL